MSNNISVSMHLGSGKNAINNMDKIKRADLHNNRKYKNNRNEEIDLSLSQYNITLVGTKNIVKDIKDFYKTEFGEALYNYNKKQIREDRKIVDYLEKMNNDTKSNIAVEMIFQIGDKQDWENATMEDKKKTIDIFKKAIPILQEKNIKCFNASLHLDETSPHLHLLAVPVVEKQTRGLEKQVSQNKVITLKVLNQIRTEVEKAFIEEYNKIYGTNKELKKGCEITEHLQVQDYKDTKKVLEVAKKTADKQVLKEKIEKDYKKLADEVKEKENENNFLTNQLTKLEKKELEIKQEIKKIENDINNLSEIKKEFEEKKIASDELKKEVLKQDFEIQKLNTEKNANDVLLYMHRENIKMVAENIEQAKIEQEKKEKEKEEEQEKVKKVQQELEQVKRNKEIIELDLQKKKEKEKEITYKIVETQEKIKNLENSYNIENEKFLELAKREKTYNVNGFKINSFEKEFVEEALEKKVEKVYIMANTEDFKLYYLNKNNDEIEMKNQIFYNGADKYYNTILSLSNSTRFSYNFRTGETLLETETEDIEFKKSGIFNLVRTLNNSNLDEILIHNYKIAKGLIQDDEEKVIEKNFTKIFADEEDEKEKDDFEINL